MRVPDDELTWESFRASGPGGQHVNKTDSAVRLRWIPAASRAVAALAEEQRGWLLSRLAGRLTEAGELIVVAREHRTQHKNKDDAVAKLHAILRSALARPKKRKPTRPTRASKERRIAAKKKRADVKKGRGRAYD